jgi:uncharacterized damage-inducible protein DinB
MKYSIDKALEVLEKTPVVLQQLLTGLSPEWTHQNEGGDTWTAYDVIGHLVHGDRTDWLPRVELILSDWPDKKFATFDRFAQFENSRGKSLRQLLEEFSIVRKASVDQLRRLNISDDDLLKIGIHPDFGEVTLLQLLSTWVVHDLDHIAQIARVMAKQYKEEVGPWIEYLKVLRN